MSGCRADQVRVASVRGFDARAGADHGSTSLVDLVKQFEEVRGSTLPAGSPALSWTITALETSAFT
jgi:hypothetical protein